MQEDLTLLSYFFKLSAWFEHNRKTATWVAGIVVLVACIFGYMSWSRGQREEQAGASLSQAVVNSVLGGPNAASPDADYLKVAAEFKGTGAAGLALLQAGTVLFESAKYEEAQRQFQRVLREYPGSPFAPQAALGVGASLDAQGKSDEALQSYKSTVERYPESVVVAQAKFAVARLYEGQKKYADASALYESVARIMGFNSSLGSEAGIRAMELKRLYAPEPASAAAAMPVPAVNAFTNLLSVKTNAP